MNKFYLPYTVLSVLFRCVCVAITCLSFSLTVETKQSYLKVYSLACSWAFNWIRLNKNEPSSQTGQCWKTENLHFQSTHEDSVVLKLNGAWVKICLHFLLTRSSILQNPLSSSFTMHNPRWCRRSVGYWRIFSRDFATTDMETRPGWIF